MPNPEPITRKPSARRMARVPGPAPEPKVALASPSKLDRIEAMLSAPGGASLAEIMAAIGWQAHSVRGAVAGVLKKRGLIITSDKIEGTRRYCAVRSDA